MARVINEKQDYYKVVRLKMQQGIDVGGPIKVQDGNGGSYGGCVVVFTNVIVVKLRLLNCVIVWVGMRLA